MIMIPRKKLDIGWWDLLYALIYCFLPGRRHIERDRLETLWSSDSKSLTLLSIRSGFDSLLQALEWPEGSEILISAITIRDMTRIIQSHGLVPVPIDLDMQTLTVKHQTLENVITENTRALVVAHIFGSRMPLDDVINIAKRNNLLFIEDCAQAFTGLQYRGHPLCDLSMFSFGPIKTNTALGGALFRFRDSTLMSKVKALQEQLPIQSRWSFLFRIFKYAILKTITYPLVFSAFVAGCHLVGKSHDDVASGAVRGFAGSRFFDQIRKQPSFPLLKLLQRKLNNFNQASINQRIESAESFIELNPDIHRPGDEAENHTHWVFPILSKSPDVLMRNLWRQGFDATRGASSLYVVNPPEQHSDMFPIDANRTMKQVIYIPVYPGIQNYQLRRLSKLIKETETANQTDVNIEKMT